MKILAKSLFLKTAILAILTALLLGVVGETVTDNLPPLTVPRFYRVIGLYLILGIGSLPFILLSNVLLLAIIHACNQRIVSTKDFLSLYIENFFQISLPFVIQVVLIQLAGADPTLQPIAFTMSFITPIASALWLCFCYKNFSLNYEFRWKLSLITLTLPVLVIGLVGVVLPVLQFAFAVSLAAKF